jgi:hypothetical protein
MSLNVFGCPPSSSLNTHKDLLMNKANEEKPYHSCGIWIKASYINHSCMSTARRAFIGDMMIVRATRDLEAGTEVTFWYHPPISTSHEDMQKKLDHWNFVRDCAICLDARATDASVLNERRAMLKSLKRMIDRAPAAIKGKKIKNLLDSLEGTYTRPTEEVPRLLVWGPQQALAHAYAAQNKPKETLEWIGKTLVALGFAVTGADYSQHPFVVTRWGLVVDHLVQTFLQARDAFIAIQALEKSRQAEEYARTAYKIIVGEDQTFSATYNHTNS